MKAVVIGGSVGGLFAALFLRRIGWDVDVYERAESALAGRGAGIATHSRILHVLTELGLPADDLGVTTTKRRAFDREGRTIAECGFRQIMTSWDRMFGLLLGAFPAERYHRRRELVRIDERAGGIAAHFADGSAVAADLLVGADGFRSTVRTRLFPGIETAYAGYVAWRALIAEADLPADVHRDVFDAMAFCLPPGEQILGYPVAGPADDLRPGHRRYNIVWYRPADEMALHRLLTDDSGRVHEMSIPPPAISRGAIADMRRAADALLSPQFRAILAAAPQPFLQPIYDIESSRMASGRVAILGDAAFLARPHVGAGVAKAAEDSRALAAALSAERDIPRALMQYEAARVPVGKRIIAQARNLGADMQAQRHSAGEQAMAARYRSPDAVLADTATLAFLDRE